MTTLTRARAITRAVFLSVAAIGTVAVAQPRSDVTVDARTNTVTKTQVVATTGLDLASARGRRVLDRRIRFAVNNVCEGWDISPVRDAHEFTRCSKVALSSARAQVAERVARNDTAPIRVSRS